MMNHSTKDKSDILKGLFVIVILLSHLFNRTGIESALGLGLVYTALGYLGVSVFLFISGLGSALFRNIFRARVSVYFSEESFLYYRE